LSQCYLTSKLRHVKNHRFGKLGPPGYSLRPLLYHQPPKDGDPERLIIQYARRSFTGYWGLPRSANIPAITEAQAEALDALHYAAEKHAVALEFKAGDIQFVNNLSIFHARGGFKDSEEKQYVTSPLPVDNHALKSPICQVVRVTDIFFLLLCKNRRHLVRLWLRDEELAWKTPAPLQDRWDKVYKGVTAENQVFPLEPTIRSASKGNQKLE
jgi:hypothetical protein